MCEVVEVSQGEPRVILRPFSSPQAQEMGLFN